MTQPPLPPAGWQEEPGGTRFRRWVIAAAIVVLVGGAVVVLTARGGDSLAAYEECRHDVQPVFGAMQGLGSRLDVGMVQSEYRAKVGDVQAAYDRLPANPAPACQPVVRALGEAMEAYAQASSEWNECGLNLNGEEKCQELWLTADQAIAAAKKRISSLTGGADAVAAAESEAAQIEADTLAQEQVRAAQVAMAAYAVHHSDSYAGATPEKLREIEPSLPPRLEVTEAGFEYYSISVASKSGNWFEIDHEIDGILVFKCGEHGNAGCPENGEWG